MSQRPIFNVSISQMIVSLIVLFLLLIVFLPFVQLFISILIISLLLVLDMIIDFTMNTDKLAVRQKLKLARLEDAQLQKWALKQYNLANAMLICATLGVFGLIVSGFSMIWLFVSQKGKDITIYFVACLGIGIAILGTYFTFTLLQILRNRKNNRKEIINTILESVKRTENKSL